jgi:hypothetical protein
MPWGTDCLPCLLRHALALLGSVLVGIPAIVLFEPLLFVAARTLFSSWWRTIAAIRIAPSLVSPSLARQVVRSFGL